jgi:hypothetical protein
VAALPSDAADRVARLLESARALDPRLEARRLRDAEAAKAALKEARAAERKAAQAAAAEEAARRAAEAATAAEAADAAQRAAQVVEKAQRDALRKQLRIARAAILDTFGSGCSEDVESDLDQLIELWLTSSSGSAHHSDAVTIQQLQSAVEAAGALLDDLRVPARQYAPADTRYRGLRDALEERRELLVIGVSSRRAAAANGVSAIPVGESALPAKDPWSREELSALAKAVARYPGGARNRQA